MATKKKAKKKEPSGLVIFLLAAAVVAVLIFVVAGGSKQPFADPIGIHHARIDIQDYGSITLELDGNAAPGTVSNFKELAQAGFYDGLTFHRIIEGFMMQGGDPAGNGTGGSGKSIRGEFPANGFDNPLKHTRGTISMARSSKYDSASSQFFIMHQDYPSLDGEYAAFGHVTEGMEVVDAICTQVQPMNKNGGVPTANQPKIIAITILD